MSRIGKVTRALLGACALAAVALTGLTVAASAETTLERIKSDGFIRVGFANEAPFGFATKSGTLSGEAPELAKLVLSKLGDIEMVGVLTEFGSLIPGLLAGRFDMIAAGMFILPKRCAQILFSNPTIGLGQGFVVRAGNPKNLHSFTDIAENSDAMLVVVAGGVERDYARDAGIPDDQVIVLPDFPTATAAIQTERGDALALTGLSVQNVVDTANDPNLERADPYVDLFGRGFSGFGFRKDDADLRDLFNQEMAGFVGTQAHLDLIGPLGFGVGEMPGDVTAEELCAGE